MNTFEQYWNNSASAVFCENIESGNVKYVYADEKKEKKTKSDRSKEFYDNENNFDELYDHQLEEIESRIAVRLYSEKKNKRSFDY